MRRRIVLTLDAPAVTALLDLAQREDRDPRRQAQRLLTEGLRQAGVLQLEPSHERVTAVTSGAA